MGLLSKIFSNTRKPEGFWGRMMVAGMNGGSHAALASWGLDFGGTPAEGQILDIGCGIAGFREKEIAPLFAGAIGLENVCLPEGFVKVLK